MTNERFTNLQAAVADLDLKINQLQVSAGVLSDEDQGAVDAIETASKQLVNLVHELNQPEHESPQHKAAVIEDKKVRPGETAEQHAGRMAKTYGATTPEYLPGESAESYHARTTLDDQQIRQGETPAEFGTRQTNSYPTPPPPYVPNPKVGK